MVYSVIFFAFGGSKEPVLSCCRWRSREISNWFALWLSGPDLSFGTHRINARSETVATQPSFRGAFLARQCLVPVNAFYERSGPKGHRTKWRIRLKDERIFSLVGLWEWWRNAQSGEGVEIYTPLNLSKICPKPLSQTNRATTCLCGFPEGRREMGLGQISRFPSEKATRRPNS